MEIAVEGNMTLMELLVEHEIVSSKSEFRRLVQEEAITDLTINEKLKDVNLVPMTGMTFRIGKHRFVKIK